MRSTIFTALKGDIMGISMSSFRMIGTLSGGTRAKSDASERECGCSEFGSPRAAFSFSRMIFSAARDTFDSSIVPLLGAPQVFRAYDGLLDPHAEAEVDHESGTASLHDRTRHAVEPVVGQPFLDARVDDDRHALADIERLERPGDRREPAVAGAAAALLPRLLHDPLRGLDHLLTRRRGCPARRARGPRTPRRAVPRGTAASGLRPRGPIL